MKRHILVLAIALVGFSAITAVATRGDNVGPAKRWAIVNFQSPVQIGDRLLMGAYLVVHDDEKMARGEPCTSIYRFDKTRGPQEEVYAFHCVPFEEQVCDKTTFKTLERGLDIPLLTSYQFAGDTEAHGVPLK